MALKLSRLLEFDDIVIQCHDNPDADALASGFALFRFFKKNGKKPEFIYGGQKPVTKSNLVLMIEKLGIPVEYVTALNKKPELLVTVDCQYGESNVTGFEAENIAVIDHHQVSGNMPKLCEIRSSYGSCATVMAGLLKKEGMDINEDADLATALYYGLMTDTNGFEEVSHPADKDLRDFTKYRSADIIEFKNSNFSSEELTICAQALDNVYYDKERPIAVVGAKPCDPNILGIISDMLLEVDSVECSVVYSILPYGVKLSVRSCVKETMANELASYIAKGAGGGGGHRVKAGGFLKKELLKGMGIEYDETHIMGFILQRFNRYFDETRIIYAGEHVESKRGYRQYIKKEFSMGYVKAAELARPGSSLVIRTLEGDVRIKVTDDVYLMLGIEGEVYPCREEKFRASYRLSGEDYVYPAEYEPEVIDAVSGKRLKVTKYAHSCICTGGSGIYAKKLKERVKVFTEWDRDNYYLGVEGDYIAMRMDDPKDIYVIAGHIFAKTYEPLRPKNV